MFIDFWGLEKEASEIRSSHYYPLVNLLAAEGSQRSYHLVSSYYVPGTICHCIVPTYSITISQILWGQCYYSFVIWETEKPEGQKG